MFKRLFENLKWMKWYRKWKGGKWSCWLTPLVGSGVWINSWKCSFKEDMCIALERYPSLEYCEKCHFPIKFVNPHSSWLLDSGTIDHTGRFMCNLCITEYAAVLNRKEW